MTENYPTISQVIGANVQRLRGNHTLADVASVGRALGARWSSGSIHAIERGDFKPTIETVALLLLALDGLDTVNKNLEGTLTIHDLFHTEEENQPIQLSARHSTTEKHILNLLGGGPSGSILDAERMMKKWMDLAIEEVETLSELRLASHLAAHIFKVDEMGQRTATEERLAKRADIHVDELRSWAVHLWGKTFEQHRDELAGEGATPQKKGRVSRELLEEIKTAMKDTSGDD